MRAADGGWPLKKGRRNALIRYGEGPAEKGGWWRLAATKPRGCDAGIHPRAAVVLPSVHEEECVERPSTKDTLPLAEGAQHRAAMGCVI